MLHISSNGKFDYNLIAVFKLTSMCVYITHTHTHTHVI